MKHDYEIDLLKIAAMLMIVAGHVLLTGGPNDAVSEPTLRGSVVYYTVFGLRLFTCCAVNCFVLVTGYLYYGKRVRLSRAVELWLQIVFLSAVVLVVAILCGYHPSRLQCFKTFMPLTSYSYWFMTQYFLLLLLIPTLNKLVEAMDASFARYAIVVLVFVFSVVPTVTTSSVVPVNGGYCVTWFAVMYLIGACFRKWNIADRITGLRAVVLFLVGYAGSLGVAVYGSIVGRFIPTVSGGGWLAYQYNSPFMLLEAVSLFFLFKNVNIKNRLLQKGVSTVSSLMLGVYILHSNSVFRDAFHWNGRWAGIVLHSPVAFLARVLCITICIFCAACLVDYLRFKGFAFVKYHIQNRLGHKGNCT